MTGHPKFRSLGDQLIWSARAGSATSGNGSLYRYFPGADAPELVYANPRDDCYLGDLTGSSAGYVFAEYCFVSPGRLADPPWRLWYVHGPGEEPVMFDEGGDAQQVSPYTPGVTMNDQYIAWTPDYGSGDARRVELRVVRLDSLDRPSTLVSYSILDAYVDFPALWGTELWYGNSDSDWDLDQSHPRIEMRDLADPDRPPRRLGDDIRAFMPALNDQVVVFKSGGDYGSNALNAGLLTLFWRDLDRVEVIPIPGDAEGDCNVSYPSIGNRFVAWWDNRRTRLWLFDLENHEFRRIADWERTGEEGSFERHVSGNLLAFWYSPDEEHGSLRWALLPE